MIFSGSLYILALSGVRAWGAVTPLGGLAFLAERQNADGSWDGDVGFKLNQTYQVIEHTCPHVGVTALATDGDATDTITYSLVDDAGGRFAIDSGTGVVTVAGAIDREAAASYDITVRATSSDTSSTSSA